MPRKLLSVTILSFLFHFAILFQVSAASLLAQNVVIKKNNMTYGQLFNEIEKQTGISTILSNNEIDLNDKIQIDAQTFELDNLLKEVTEGTGLTYELIEDYIVIKPLKPNEKNVDNAAQQPEKLSISGKVVDINGEPIPGATVRLEDGRGGTITQTDGSFILVYIKSESGHVLVVSFIGMETQKIPIGNQVTFQITMKESVAKIEDVVVNGFFTKKRDVSTGAVTTIKSEELLQVSSTNVLQALSILTPGLQLIENNETGSDPNQIPEFIIRGTTSLATEGELGLNSPLIIIDGVEVSMQQLYDIDIFDIDRVDILKDASATVFYGERAANGVIVITRKKVEQKDVRVRYNFVPMFVFPDLTSFKILDARRKLDFERIAGLYDNPYGEDDQAYLYKLNNINRGVNTDWIAQPLRISYAHNHSVSVTGRGSSMEYGVTGRYGDSRGVMKDDYRKNYQLGFFYSYHLSDKLTISYRADFGQTNIKNSPYGNFSNYVKMNPYNPIYDEFGEIIPRYSFYNNQANMQKNPLYDALETSSFDVSKSKNIRNNLNLRWDIKKGLYITARGDVSVNDRKSDVYASPEAVAFMNTDDPLKKGLYSVNGSEGVNFSGNVVLNYNLVFDNEGTVLGIHAGGNISKNRSSNFGFSAQGFRKDHLSDINFASQYIDGAQPSGGENLSNSVGGFTNMNFSLKNRYYLDGSIRVSGSSKFGVDNRYAPFWSVGIGWNLHNEDFLKRDWINILRFRMSKGVVGSVNFPPYQAITTYRYDRNSYITGLGALPITMGNPLLTWQSTANFNVGINGTLFDNRFDFSFDYYKQDTEDMLLAIDLPPSVGVESTKTNLGEMVNSGFDLRVSAAIIRTDDIYWRLTASGSHTFNQIKKIGEALKRKNEEIGSDEGLVVPRVLFKEGGSATAIYAVRSAGIDPATGKEIFINKDGEHTFVYDTNDKVEVGNTNPALRGGISTSFRYKGITLSSSMSYTLGGDIYNGTLAGKVENIEPMENVDERAYTLRWKQPGDVVSFLGIPQNNQNNGHTERFVQRRNELYISNINVSYEFKTNFLKNIGLKRLRVGFGLNDIARLSTVKFERGMSYPYSRNYNIIISPTF